MVLCTKGSGILRLIKGMVAEYKFGPMDLDTMDFGRTAWPADMDDSCTQRAMSTRVPGTKTRPMALEFTPTIMEAGTRASGSTTSSMERESKSGQTVLNIRESTLKV